MQTKKRFGFTLLEIIISIGVLAIMVGVSSQVMMSVIKSNQKAAMLTAVKRGGDHTLSLISENIRAGRDFSCVGAGACDVMRFTDKNFVSTEIGLRGDGNCSNGYIYIKPNDGSAPQNHQKITSDNSDDGVDVTGLNFAISRASGVSTVTVTLDLHNSLCNSTADVSEQFVTVVVARNIDL